MYDQTPGFKIVLHASVERPVEAVTTVVLWQADWHWSGGVESVDANAEAMVVDVGNRPAIVGAGTPNVTASLHRVVEHRTRRQPSVAGPKVNRVSVISKVKDVW